jgi:hypothetical protein
MVQELGARILNFEFLHNAKGLARMSRIRHLPPSLTTGTVFVGATGDASRLRGYKLAEQKGCRQSVLW